MGDCIVYLQTFLSILYVVLFLINSRPRNDKVPFCSTSKVNCMFCQRYLHFTKTLLIRFHGTKLRKYHLRSAAIIQVLILV